ncbi:MAG: hypothetical protein HN686_00180 [Bacteroidetes bacterium]|jgi:hypothetical protein|nr:hypothetical protein [Bacteroidota bacterium]MBT7579462.1 hypothetical protein [Candidatus Neomarinimicrobiota bacterium]
MFKSNEDFTLSTYSILPILKIFYRYWSPTIYIVLIQFSIFNFHSCGIDVEDPTQPTPPVWVQKSLPDEWPERGIDAHEFGIYLEWAPNSGENISAYLIFRAEYFDQNDSLSDYELLTRLESESSALLEYIDTDIQLRTYFNYKLKTEDMTGNLSDYSDSRSYSLLPTVQLSTMVPNGPIDKLDGARQLRWNYGYDIEMETYCLTITTDGNELVWREVFNPGNYTSAVESWTIPVSVSLEPDEVYKWRIDTGAQYIDDFETAGSESPWATFLFVGE